MWWVMVGSLYTEYPAVQHVPNYIHVHILHKTVGMGCVVLVLGIIQTNFGWNVLCRAAVVGSFVDTLQDKCRFVQPAWLANFHVFVLSGHILLQFVWGTNRGTCFIVVKWSTNYFHRNGFGRTEACCDHLELSIYDEEHPLRFIGGRLLRRLSPRQASSGTCIVDNPLKAVFVMLLRQFAMCCLNLRIPICVGRLLT